MNPETIGYLGFLLLFCLMGAGLPIGVAMGIVGFGGLLLLLPFHAAIAKMAIAPYALISSYSFATLPLFLLMGHILLSTGQGSELFRVARKWFGRIPGGLAMATIAGCAAFGAVSASAIATVVTMALVAIPEMKKAKYETALSNGSVAAGGPIGGLIPPSTTLIIYGIITENSISRLFIGGVIPGIIITASYLIMIGVRCWINPELGPPGNKVSVMEKFNSMKQIWELILLAVFTIGGLIIGLFTATEAGAVGAFGAFLSAILRKRLTIKKMNEAFIEAMKSSGMIYGILIGAMIFNYFMALSDLPKLLSEWVVGLNLPPTGIMTVIVIIYIILGALMDEPSIQLLTIPIFYPLIIDLGFDPIWFGVVQCKLLSIGMIAPPVGISVFVIAGLDKTVPMVTIYRGVLWFILCDIFTVALFMVWPQTVIWLPNLLN